MCNFSEDIKEIFLHLNGFHIVCELLNSKDEDILLNNLRLIMTLITSQNVGEPNEIGKKLAEENDNKMTSQFIKLIKEGPGIFFCMFDKQVYFMAITLLRAFIQNSDKNSAFNTKALIMKDKGVKDSRYPRSVVDVMMDWLKPANLDDINSEIENAIISLFI